MNNAASVLLLTLLLSLLNACGWHLRGSGMSNSAPEAIYLDASAPHGAFASTLRQRLQTAGTTLLDQQQDAPLRLVIGDETLLRRTASVSTDALASEYELLLSVEYRLTDESGTNLIPLAKAQTSGSYSFNRNAVIATAEEERLILAEMRRTLANTILRRLQFIDRTQSERISNGQTAP